MEKNKDISQANVKNVSEANFISTRSEIRKNSSQKKSASLLLGIRFLKISN
jgi:c-di-GMP-binding flagellar brake protein YcgR